MFTIRCESEAGLVLSSEIEIEAWNSIEILVDFLNHHKRVPLENESFFLWKNKKGYLAKAKETYAWRAVIDLIKENDLGKIGLEIEIDRKRKLDLATSPLLRSKPIMLRLAGEITNALIHSYNNRHCISFSSV